MILKLKRWMLPRDTKPNRTGQAREAPRRMSIFISFFHAARNSKSHKYPYATNSDDFKIDFLYSISYLFEMV